LQKDLRLDLKTINPVICQTRRIRNRIAAWFFSDTGYTYVVVVSDEPIATEAISRLIGTRGGRLTNQRASGTPANQRATAPRGSRRVTPATALRGRATSTTTGGRTGRRLNTDRRFFQPSVITRSTAVRMLRKCLFVLPLLLLGVLADEKDVLELTDETFESELERHENTLVMFYAPW